MTWTRAADIDPGAAIAPAIGDCWQKRDARGGEGFAWITDVLPWPGIACPADLVAPVERVCVLTVNHRYEEQREWMPVADLRRRFVFRRRQ